MIEVRIVPTQMSGRACVAELSRSLVQGGAAQTRRPARRAEPRAARLHEISATHPARKPRCSAHPVSSDDSRLRSDSHCLVHDDMNPARDYWTT